MSVQVSWRWVIGAMLVVAAFAALILHKLSGGHDGLGRVAVDAIEAANRPKLAELQSRIQLLRQDERTNSAEVVKAEAQVERSRQQLQLVYSATGLSNDEVAARLAALKL